jgi:hypothetical protein
LLFHGRRLLGLWETVSRLRGINDRCAKAFRRFPSRLPAWAETRISPHGNRLNACLNPKGTHTHDTGCRATEQLRGAGGGSAHEGILEVAQPAVAALMLRTWARCSGSWSGMPSSPSSIPANPAHRLSWAPRRVASAYQIRPEGGGLSVNP